MIIKNLLARSVRSSKRFTRFAAPLALNSLRTHSQSIKLKQPFNHYYFGLIKTLFTLNTIPLIGGVTSYYLSDIKLPKTWKFANGLYKAGDINYSYIKLKPRTRKLTYRDLKRSRLKRRRLQLMRSLLNTNLNLPTFARSILNFKTLTRRLRKFKPSLCWAPAPTYVFKWKTSYPLMFTNNSYNNKRLRPRIELTIKRFIKKRRIRRARRSKKRFRRNIKRLHRSKDAAIRLLSRPRNSKLRALVTLTKNRLKNHPYLQTSRSLSKPSNRNQKKTVSSQNVTPPHPNIKGQIRTLIETYYSVMPSKLAYSSMHEKHDSIGLPLHLITNPRTQSKVLIQIRYKLRGLGHQNRLTRQLTRLFPYVRSRTGKSFIFKKFGLFLNSFVLFNQKKPFTYKYRFKKKMFTFLYPNEVRNKLMARKRRIVFYRLIYKRKHKSKHKPYHSTKLFNRASIDHYKISLQNSSNAPITRALFGNTTHTSRIESTFPNYASSRDDMLYDQNFAYRGVDLTFKRSEVRIPRVRFKPGYQRMWRKARLALQESMGFKFIYQHQLTTRLIRFYKNSNKYSFSRSEMSANRIIMYSRLLPDNPTINIFVEQQLIYLNGQLLYSQRAVLSPNDLVQIIISLWYYSTYRWISNWTLKRHKKFKRLVYRKGLAGRYKVMKLKKQRSYYTPHWIYLARYDISDVKPFLEVDYLTLSAFILYEPYLTYYYSPDESPDFRPNIYRMYNWKYIN